MPKPASLSQELSLVVRTLVGFLGVLWLCEIVDQSIFHGGLDRFGVQPREVEGLLGLVTAPFLHGGYPHLISNTVGLLLLGGLLLLWSRREFWLVTIASTLVGGLGTWLVGMDGSVHIGASGVLFGFFGYLLLRGWFERKFGAMALSLVVGWLFGSMASGMVPGLAGLGISWEEHLFGFLGGVLMAWRWRKKTR